MDKKRKFKITVNKFRAEGGELVIGTVSVEFVEYWQERNENELIEHLELCLKSITGFSCDKAIASSNSFSELILLQLIFSFFSLPPKPNSPIFIF